LASEFGSFLSINKAFFAPDETRVAIHYYDQAVEFWDALSGERLTEALPQAKVDVGWVGCSGDGRWVAVLLGDGRIRIWETPPPPLPAPDWLSELAEALAGQRFNRQGFLEPVSPGELWVLQQRLKHSLKALVKPTGASSAGRDSKEAGFYDRWAHWFFAEPSTRTVLPSSPRTVAQHAQMLAEERVSYAAAREALLLQPTNVTAMTAVALTTSDARFADWLSQQALERAPDSEEVLWGREVFLRDQGRLADSLAAMERRPSLGASNCWMWADKARTLEKLGRFGEAHVAYSRVIELTPNTEEMQIFGLQARWRLLRRMGRLDEAQNDFLAAKRIPSRATILPGSRFKPLDLRRHLNQGLQDLGLTQAMGATNPIAQVLEFGGIGFELCGYILLDGKNPDPAFPPRELNIQVGQRCRTLHFLQSCQLADNSVNPNNPAVGAYLVHYKGIADVKIPIVRLRDVGYYFDTGEELDRATEAWAVINDKGAPVRLFKRSWNNPHPEVEIKSIDFLTDGPDSPRPILFAITAEK
jgi:tetratricopeptide (TPR) repeat protein